MFGLRGTSSASVWPRELRDGPRGRFDLECGRAVPIEVWTTAGDIGTAWYVVLGVVHKLGGRRAPNRSLIGKEEMEEKVSVSMVQGATLANAANTDVVAAELDRDFVLRLRRKLRRLFVEV
eukprot:GFKZ01007442.1.p3 GENE.GFKZ01007442.1~~GFKZ01007442.1.p3  ORF type:complete len:121 (+),score=18.19 GFKZ01007442.1:1646-2008(+)